MEQYRQFAVDTALQAGKILLENHGRNQNKSYKTDNNFKIEVDDIVDRFVRERISERFPEHNIQSEENEPRNNRSPLSWVFDPLDGTLPYTLSTSDHFAVSIALVETDEPVVGVIYLPKRDELYVAERGKGATLDGRSIRTSGTERITHATIGIEYGKVERDRALKLHELMLKNDGVVYPLTYGSAATMLAFVSGGFLDGFVSLNLEPWDMAAAVCLIRESGGVVTDATGHPWKLGDESILAANPVLHEKLLKMFRK